MQFFNISSSPDRKDNQLGIQFFRKFSNTPGLIVAIAFVFGLLVWIIDSLLDFFIFYQGQGTLVELMITDIPAHETYIRVVIVLLFVIFGVLVSVLYAGRNRLLNSVIKSEEKYSLLFENMAEGFALHRIVFNNEGKPVDYIFLDVNKAFEQLTGLKLVDVAGKKVTEVLPAIELDPANWIETFGKVAIKNEKIRFEQYSQPLKRWYSVHAFSPKENHFATIFEDITHRKNIERRLKHINDILSSLRNVNQLITKEMDRDKLIAEACNLLVEGRSFISVWISIFEDAGNRQKVFNSGVGKGFLELERKLNKGVKVTCQQKALQNKGVQVIEDPYSTCKECPLSKKYKGTSGIVSRLEYNEDLYGTITVCTLKDMAQDTEELDLFNELVGDISYALHSMVMNKQKQEVQKKLNEHRKNLEKLVEERTSSLKKKNDELERLNKLFVGREFRIKELKDQIEEIKNRN